MLAKVFFAVSVLLCPAGRSQTLPPGLSASVVKLDTVLSFTTGSANSKWLITARHGEQHSHVQISLLKIRGKTPIVTWNKVLPEVYDPAVYYQPQWRFHDSPVLLLQYQHGAAWESFTVIGLGRNGPIILQTLEGGLFHVTYAASSDGNGDLRMAETSDPFGFHCYDWQPARSVFAERPCKTLAGLNPDGHGPRTPPAP